MAKRSRGGVILLIALFKLFKALTLISLGVGALLLARGDATVSTLHRLVAELGFHPYSHLVNRALGKVMGIDQRRLAEISVGTFAYAAVFLVEGVGLLLRKRWAEYLTTLVTGSFVPFEIYEMAVKPSALKGVGIGVNVLIVVYLVVRLVRAKRESR